MEKSDGFIHVLCAFKPVALLVTSLNGICKPEVEIHQNRKYTVSLKTCDYIFYNNFNSKCPITTIFGIVSSN